MTTALAAARVASLSSVDMAEFENHYRRLRRAQERLDTAEARRRTAVIEAREAGLTFGEIGECLAVSRQAARALMLRTIEADRE